MMIAFLFYALAAYYAFCGILWLIGFSLRFAFPAHTPRPIPPNQAWIYVLLGEARKRPIRRNEALFRDQLTRRVTRIRGARELQRMKPEEPRNN